MTMLLYIFFILVISILILLISFLLMIGTVENKMKKSYFECGLENYKISRISFSVQFFLIGIIFVLFDLEVIILINVILFPFSYSLSFINVVMIFIFFIFITWWMEFYYKNLKWVN